MSALSTIRMLFGKSHVRQHQRTSSTGHLETVREHERIARPANRLMEAIGHINTLRPFMGAGQIEVLGEMARKSEEKEFFHEKVREYAARVKAMPKTYETDGQGDNAIAYLHYFKGGMDWYITERDVDPDNEGQIQAYGSADLGQGPERGYVNIKELIDNGVELDLYWTPKTIGEAERHESPQPKTVESAEKEKPNVDLKAFMRNYRRNESQNRHTLNFLRLAEAFGNDEQIALAKRGMQHIKDHGYQDYALSKEMFEKIHVPLWPKAQSMAQEQGLHPRLAKAVADVEIFVKSRLVEQWTPDASLIFNKARVRQHARTSSTGKVENVREHERATPPHQPPPMDTFTATMIAEGVDEADEETQLRAWQHLIDTGVVWQLQGWFGRRASELIESGICHRAGGPVQKALTLTFGKSVVKQHPRKEKSGKVSTVKQYSDSRTKKPVGGAEARDTSHGQKPTGVEISGIQSVDFHRNGVTGEGFHVVKFQYAMPGEEEERPMVGIVFDQAHHVAVFDLEKLSQGDTSFGSNSWRGDQFEPLLRRAIEQQEKDLQGKREQGAQQRSKRDEDAEKVKKYDATEKKVSAIDQNHAIAKQLSSAGYGLEEAKAIAHVIETGGMAGTDKDIQDFAQDLQKHGLKSKQADDIAKKYYSKKEPESGKSKGNEGTRSRDEHYI